MASKRKLAERARKLARRQSQAKPGGSSTYALKRRRMLGGWENPRSPFRFTGASPAPAAVDGASAADGLNEAALQAGRTEW